MHPRGDPGLAGRIVTLIFHWRLPVSRIGMEEGKEVGRITHYFSKIGVAVVELTGTLNVGDTVHIKGAHTDFKQVVGSMEIEHKPIQTAKKGQSIGLKLDQKVHENDVVFK